MGCCASINDGLVVDSALLNENGTAPFSLFTCDFCGEEFPHHRYGHDLEETKLALERHMLEFHYDNDGDANDADNAAPEDESTGSGDADCCYFTSQPECDEGELSHSDEDEEDDNDEEDEKDEEDDDGEDAVLACSRCQEQFDLDMNDLDDVLRHLTCEHGLEIGTDTEGALAELNLMVANAMDLDISDEESSDPQDPETESFNVEILEKLCFECPTCGKWFHYEKYESLVKAMTARDQHHRAVHPEEEEEEFEDECLEGDLDEYEDWEDDSEEEYNDEDGLLRCSCCGKEFLIEKYASESRARDARGQHELDKHGVVLPHSDDAEEDDNESVFEEDALEDEGVNRNLAGTVDQPVPLFHKKCSYKELARLHKVEDVQFQEVVKAEESRDFLWNKIAFNATWKAGPVLLVIPQENADQLKLEIEIFGKVGRHPHVRQILAVTMDPDDRRCILVECPSLGRLNDLLTDEEEDLEETINPSVLRAVAVQICDAMCQLAALKVVLRDLRAGNISVFSFDKEDEKD
eukprot:2149504-Rhodomonas_salina.1